MLPLDSSPLEPLSNEPLEPLFTEPLSEPELPLLPDVALRLSLASVAGGPPPNSPLHRLRHERAEAQEGGASIQLPLSRHSYWPSALT